MITYLSSLYEVFPEPPAMHPLYDMESQRRVQEYREMAQQLLYWCKEKTSLLQERSFGTTLIEFKRLSSDLNKFRNEEIPPRHREKQRLFTTYKELERYFESTGEIEIENDLRPDALEKAWNRLLSALGDREHILQSEISKVDNISRLAEKVQREIKSPTSASQAWKLESPKSRVESIVCIQLMPRTPLKALKLKSVIWSIR
jgi:dystonin